MHQLHILWAHIKNCWEKGGGAEGQMLDWYRELKAKKVEDAKKKKTKRHKVKDTTIAAITEEDDSGSDSWNMAMAKMTTIN
jgi:hypothetical protein